MKRDLLVGERPHLLSEKRHEAKERCVFHKSHIECRARAAKVDQRAPVRLPSAVRLLLFHVEVMNNPFASKHPSRTCTRSVERRILASVFGICGWNATHGGCAEELAVIDVEMAERSLAETHSLFENCVKNRAKVAGRGIDDLQHLGGRGLLLQRLARLGDEARVFHRDDRLRREVLQQRNFFVGERPHFPPKGCDIAEQGSASLRSGTI